MNFIARTLLCFMISFVLVEFPITKSHAQAGMISTSEALNQMSRTQGEKNISNFLERSDVKDQLVKLGITPEEASTRLAGLSDKEVKQLSHDIDQATVGGSVGGVLVLVVLVLLIIYLAKRI